jgi:hypothetical protein
MADPIVVGTKCNWINDANTRIINLWDSNVSSTAAHAMFDSSNNTAYTVPAGKIFTLLQVCGMPNYNTGGILYIENSSITVAQLSTETTGGGSGMWATPLTVNLRIEFAAANQVIVVHNQGTMHVNMIGVETDV